MMELLELLRGVAWKLADRTCVFFDAEGFQAMALPGELPAGVLRWGARLLASVAQELAWWWIPYLIPAIVLGITVHCLVHGLRRFRYLPLWICLSMLIALLPLAGLSYGLWQEEEPAFIVQNLLGLWVGCGIFAFLRSVCRHCRLLGPYLALCIGLIGFIPFGFYSILAALVVFLLTFPYHGRSRRSLIGRISAVVLSIWSVSLMGRCFYNDLATSTTWRYALGLRPWRLTPLSLGGQLEAEYHLRREDYSAVVSTVARQRNSLLRMMIAYRIYAQCRLGQLPDLLFHYPIPSRPGVIPTAEADMDGWLLLFGYGFMLPAQQQIFEHVVSSGWEPAHFRYLGDIAFIQNEKTLARRYYLQLARCPFRSDFARARLAALARPGGIGAEDLVPIAQAAYFWQKWHGERGEAFYAMWNDVETYIYNRYRRLREAPEWMARMSIAASLLYADAKKLTENHALLDYFSPAPKPWSKVTQEAIVSYPNGLSGVRAGAISKATLERYERWLIDVNKVTRHTLSGSEYLAKLYGDTFWYYEWYTK